MRRYGSNFLFTIVAATMTLGGTEFAIRSAWGAPLDPLATVLDSEHTDLAAAYAGGWDLFVSGDESGDFAPHQALLFVDRPARGNRQAGTNFDFIGVPAGQKYWRLPQTQNTKLLYLGTNANGVSSGDLGSYVETDPRIITKASVPWLKYNVVGVHGLTPEDPAPGHFSVWASGDTAPTVWVSTAEGGLSGSDTLFGIAQSHLHFNWGFTARGVYGVDIVASAYLGPGKTNPTSSAMYTFYFGVEAGLPGDANLDSKVDGGDYTLWADHFLATPDATWKQGDFNLDYVVDGADYTIWADHFGNGIPAASSAAVPEPASWALAALGSIFLFVPLLLNRFAEQAAICPTSREAPLGRLVNVLRSLLMKVSQMALWIMAGLVVLPIAAAQAAFDVVLTTEHVDVGLAFEDDAWDLHVHDETNDAEYEPDAALLYAGVDAQTNRPAPSSFDFIGVGAGEQYWRLPQSEDPALLYLGIGAEEIEDGTFADWTVTDPRVDSTGPYVILQLIDVRGPGDFSVWSSTDDGPLVWMSTFDGGITAEDRFFQLVGGHSHVNWGFTKAGLYEVDFQATAYFGPGATNPSVSDVATYHFGVEAVPEPASWILLGCGGLAVAVVANRSPKLRSAS